MDSKSKGKKVLQKSSLVKFDISNKNLQCFFKRLRSNQKIQKSMKSKDKNIHNKSKIDKFNSDKTVFKSQSNFLNKNCVQLRQNLNNQSVMPVSKSKSPDIIHEIVNKVITQIQINGIHYKQEKVDQFQNQQFHEQQLNSFDETIWKNAQVSTEKSFVSTKRSNLSEYNYPMCYFSPVTFNFNWCNEDRQGGKKMFEILECNILNDGRTTVMIKNIPNKYTLNYLTEQIDENNQDQYDFLYLPYDFNNNCNIGYAFINFIDCFTLRNFFNEFNNKKWHKFRSGKICALAYARLQGRNNLIEHFHNSKVLNQKDKRFRPVIKQMNKMQKISNLLNKQRTEITKKD